MNKEENMTDEEKEEILMETQIRELIASYKTKLNYLHVMMDEERKGGVDIKNMTRLNTKHACYTTFIIELEKLLKNE